MHVLNLAQMVKDRWISMEVVKDSLSTSFSPTLCVTHRCNLKCVYCYQENKSSARMSFEVAKKCIDDIFTKIPESTKTIEISFIGGEPLLEMKLIRDIYDYTTTNYADNRLHFFATTNGTVLNSDDKEWLLSHKKNFILGLSLDGTREDHNMNRSNSFDLIDIPFFVNTWPDQGVKMTISKTSIENLAENIISIHRLGFKSINGVNFAEGDFEWETESDIKALAKQLSILLNYYTKNPNIKLDQMFGKHIEFCSGADKTKKKSCGMGTSTIFYDVDGKQYPCSFVTPMTFSECEIDRILETDFNCVDNFTDEDCLNNCFLFPICGSCSGANYLQNHSFSNRVKTRCKMNKLIAIYIAELHTRRILEHKELYEDSNQIYYLIESITSIKENYFEELKKYIYD